MGRARIRYREPVGLPALTSGRVGKVGLAPEPDAVMSGIVWLASYPKSGNTWVRLFLAAMGRVPDLKTMVGTARGASARSTLQQALDLSFEGLSPSEVDCLRPLAYRHLAARNDGRPLLFKAHDQYRLTPAGEPLFPPDISRGCLHVVRDPRDVCLSLAAHCAVTVDRAIAIMAGLEMAPTSRSAAARGITSEFWGSWSEHAQSWLNAPMSRLILRYEDMLSDPVRSFAAAAQFCGLEGTAQELAGAVERTRFQELATQEAANGFLERPAALPRFFRVGQAGQWRTALSPAQQTRIERDHGVLMARLTYLN